MGGTFSGTRHGRDVVPRTLLTRKTCGPLHLVGPPTYRQSKTQGGVEMSRYHSQKKIQSPNILPVEISLGGGKILNIDILVYRKFI